MSSSEKLAIAAHLHVLLRRKTGRVTDTEWMATNQEYAHAVAHLARGKAIEEGHAELAVWADKLEAVMGAGEPDVARPLATWVADAAKAHTTRAGNAQRPVSGDSSANRWPELNPAEGDAPGHNEPRYVKGLR